jgi:hypothetical protein
VISAGLMSRRILYKLSVWSKPGKVCLTSPHPVPFRGNLTPADVFVDDITHLLVICTSSKVSLLGLSRPSPREINLYATNLSADAPVAMISVSGTASGRIFLLGVNKDLYELEYSAESSWFFGSSTRVQLHNRSSGSFANWVPTVFSSGSESRPALSHWCPGY